MSLWTSVKMSNEFPKYFFMLFCIHWLHFWFFFQDVEHLKPHIVRSLANAEFYCMALSVLYADPNFHNLNHWGIIQALARKGICVAEPSDCSLTETVLIQSTPLKLVSFVWFYLRYKYYHPRNFGMVNQENSKQILKYAFFSLGM